MIIAPPKGEASGGRGLLRKFASMTELARKTPQSVLWRNSASSFARTPYNNGWNRPAPPRTASLMAVLARRALRALGLDTTGGPPRASFGQRRISIRG